MTMHSRRAPYAGWRALAATVLVMAGAVGAHGWAGGHVPDGSVLIALAALVLGGSLLVLRGTVAPRLLLPLVAAAQAGLHATFVGSTAEHAGHAGHAAMPAEWSWQMLLAHTAVTVLTALVWQLCQRSAIVVVTALRRTPAPVVRRATIRPATAVPDALVSLALVMIAPRRGPPVMA